MVKLNFGKYMRKNYRIVVLFIFIIVLIASCNRSESVSPTNKLEYALKMSRENRHELEKVLKHYSINKNDSLKLKAAKFLIENMTYHSSISGSYIDNHIKIVDSIYNDVPIETRYFLYKLPEKIDSSKIEIKRELNIHIITADFIISNIENSFNIWQNSPCFTTVSFDDFCEYILPYKIDNEPLKLWKDSSSIGYYSCSKFKEISLDLSIYALHVSDKLSNYEYFSNIFSADTLLAPYTFSLEDLTIKEVTTLRAAGIPIAIDFIPFSTTYHKADYWSAIIDEKYINHNYTLTINQCAPKIFRMTYSINPVPDDQYNYVPEFIRDPYNKDVTDIYQNVATIEYDFGKLPHNVTYGYLAIFKNGVWNEVTWSKLQNGKGTFKKMGLDEIYMPVYYVGKDKRCANYPIHINSKGEVSQLKANNRETKNLTIQRKSRYNYLGDYYGNYIVGCKILALNDLSKLEYDSISTIKHYNYMQYDTVHTNSKAKYKCWFLKNSSFRRLNLAELAFYDENNRRLIGEIIEINNSQEIIKMDTLNSKFFDNNMLTYSHVKSAIGICFKEPVNVSYVKYATYNDGNGIYPGEEYELFYFDNGQWMSLGLKTVINNSIEYENAPTEALFWLCNQTKGKEERPFTIRDGRVRFW